MQEPNSLYSNIDTLLANKLATLAQEIRDCGVFYLTREEIVKVLELLYQINNKSYPDVQWSDSPNIVINVTEGNEVSGKITANTDIFPVVWKMDITIPKGPKGDKGDTGLPFTYDMFTSEQLTALRGPQGKTGNMLYPTVSAASGLLSWNIMPGNYTETPEPVIIKGPQGDRGPQGIKGDPFSIVCTYPTIEAMEADLNNREINDYVMIASTIEEEDNAKLYVKTAEGWVFISDFSGAQGIQGPAGTISIGEVSTIAAGYNASITNVGTPENAILNIDIPKGDTGVGIRTVEQTTISNEDGGTNHVTVTMDNNDTYDFQFKNGSKGTKGDKGDRGFSGVHVGEEAPIEEDCNVWINPTGGVISPNPDGSTSIPSNLESRVSTLESNAVNNLVKTYQSLTDEEKQQVQSNLGVMPATPSGDPLHNTYIKMFGAQYNAQSGLWTMSGVTDLTTAEMQELYNCEVTNSYAFNASIRVAKPQALYNKLYRQGWGVTYADSAGYFFNCTNVRYIDFQSTIYVRTIDALFQNCAKLVTINGVLYNTGTTNYIDMFKGCSALVNVQLRGINFNTSLADSANISKQSVLYMINNGHASKTLIITLHPTAYERLINDTDIISALTAHSNISLASA